MQRQIEITIKTTIYLPDIWYENNNDGDEIAMYDFNEKCCIYEKIINILQERRNLCNGYTNNCSEIEDEINIELKQC